MTEKISLETLRLESESQVRGNKMKIKIASLSNFEVPKSERWSTCASHSSALSPLWHYSLHNTVGYEVLMIKRKPGYEIDSAALSNTTHIRETPPTQPMRSASTVPADLSSSHLSSLSKNCMAGPPSVFTASFAGHIPFSMMPTKFTNKVSSSVALGGDLVTISTLQVSAP